MEQLTLFDLDDYRLKCPYCGSEDIHQTTHIYFGFTHTAVWCNSCQEVLQRKETKYVPDQPST